MIPETNILNAIDNNDFWVDLFPEGNTTVFPKGLIKRISCVPIKNKSAIVTGVYETVINVLWYDVNKNSFDSKMSSILTLIDGLKDNNEIRSVSFIDRDDGYDFNLALHVMNLEFKIKHTI